MTFNLSVENKRSLNLKTDFFPFENTRELWRFSSAEYSVDLPNLFVFKK